jgi:hypothetical protein
VEIYGSYELIVWIIWIMEIVEQLSRLKDVRRECGLKK